MSYDHKEAAGYPAMDDEELESFLRTQELMYLATITKDDWPHNTPVLFLFENSRLYFASVKWKKKLENIRQNSRVSCTIDAALDQGDIRGVMIQGEAEVISDEQKRDEIESLWLDSFESYIDYGGDSKEQILANRDYVEILPREVLSWGGHIEDT